MQTKRNSIFIESIALFNSYQFDSNGYIDGLSQLLINFSTISIINLHNAFSICDKGCLLVRTAVTYLNEGNRQYFQKWAVFNLCIVNILSVFEDNRFIC